MKLGLNSVLFGGHDLPAAFRCAAMCGYEGIELSAIDGMSEHLVLAQWREIVPQIKDMALEHGLELLAIEQPSLDPEKMEPVMMAAAQLGIPIVNCGPGGRTGDEESLKASIAQLRRSARFAAQFNVTLCVKAHIGCAVHDTSTTLRALAEINESAFGLDFDPSHILRAREDPVAALKAVIARVRHIHIRDCRSGIQGPGTPEEQTPGRGDIDLRGIIQVLKENAYAGPIDLEIIGAREYSLEACSAIAAESRAYLSALIS